MTLLPKQLELVIQDLLEEERAKIPAERQERFDGKVVKYFQAGLQADEITRTRMPRLDYAEGISYLLGHLWQGKAVDEELFNSTGLWLPALEKMYQEQEPSLEKYSRKLCGRDYYCEECGGTVNPETGLTSLYNGLYCGEQCHLMACSYI